MSYSRKLEETLAIIISCTRRIKRPKDLVTLAQNISYAEQELHGIENVAKEVGLSVQQLQDFLSVKKLSGQVKALVAERVIDSVDVVKTMSKLPTGQQEILAHHFAAGKITSKDMRNLTTFARRFPNRSIRRIIGDYEKSRDVRLYVAEFRLPKGFNDRDRLHRQFEKVVGKDEIKRLQIQEATAVLEVTTLGYKRLSEAVRGSKMTLRRFIDATVSELAEKK